MAKSGRRREWAKATDDTDIFPAIDDDEEADPTLTEEDDKPAESGRFADVQLRLKRFGQAVVDRLPQLGVVIVAGLALCMSFPPFGWWYLAIAAFAMLAWVLTRESTTFAGGFGYGFLFGLAFYLPLLPWIGGFVGAVPWFCLCVLEALFPALFGLGAVAARRLSGWPFWFAALWAAQEWLKSTVPFGGFPWGVVGFSQTDGPLLAIAQLGGAPLLSFAAVLIGFSLAAITFEVVKWWQHNDESQKSAPPAVVLPGVCISAVLLTTALA
ncbi:MAG: apolipoprotein N-acyltransferase, partial [Mycobacterium sp.]|nr:apolipoprotein N-acyltransferase [Mycobacterium sp.]